MVCIKLQTAMHTLKQEEQSRITRIMMLEISSMYHLKSDKYQTFAKMWSELWSWISLKTQDNGFI